MANPTEIRLARLLAYFENGAASVRATLAFLAHDPTSSPRRGNGNGNGNGHHPVMLDALALDEHRARKVGKKPGPKPGSPARGGWKRGPNSKTKDRIRAQRERTAEALARFDPSTPKTPDVAGVADARKIIGSALRRGYLKKKAGGYVRTGKPFFVDPSASATQ